MGTATDAALAAAAPQTRSAAASPPIDEAADLVLRFGILLLRSGTTTFRVRERMRGFAQMLGVEHLEAQISLNGIGITVRAGSEACTRIAENLILGINTQRLAALEALARRLRPDAPLARVRAELDAIEHTPALYSVVPTAIAVGLACGAFAFFNDGSAREVGVSAVSAAVGQAVRTMLLRRHFNQLVVTAFCAFATAALYCLLTTAMAPLLGAAAGDRAGFISSVLFLVPGFPLVASLLDMIQLEFLAGLTRLAYSVLLLLAGAVGVSGVAWMLGFAPAVARAPAFQDSTLLLLRAVGSLIGGAGFAVLYNSPRREAVIVGLLAVAGNCLRLELHDAGAGLAAASFLGALLVGLLATLADLRLHLPRITLTVPGVILMTPGTLSYDTIVLFAQGQVLPALGDAVLAGFVIGAMAMGLAVARIATDRTWAFET